ncbi:hypothetical protein F5883DRAFT_651289 [Diaporthe sp. PMI_573]|nr:hypothetical protein F5883DRAFT_668129 [Diaporthaceae sp. PMI_573]KAH8752769.1 hypothetical protein F5883DRAFT_651289 [Diaporthaceae sp. PMI_573]
MASSAASPTTNSSEFAESAYFAVEDASLGERIKGFQLDLSDEDLRCLQASLPLNDKVVNAVLHILVTLAPISFTAVDSLANIAPNSTRRYLQAPNVLGPGTVILVPIHTPPSASSKSRWVLATISSGVLRILDFSPAHGDTKFAEEKIKTLFPGCELGRDDNEKEHAYQSSSDIDSGVDMLAKAFYTITGFHGTAITIWRDILFLLLRTAMGQTCDIPWAKELDANALAIDDGQVDGLSMRQLWCPGPDGIVQYDAACREIDAQERYLAKQREGLGIVRLKKIEKRAGVAEQGRRVYDVLRSLSEVSLQQAQTLAAEKADCEEMSLKIRNSHLGFLSGDHTEAHFRGCVEKAEILLKFRDGVATTLLQVVEVLDETVKALEGD